MTTAGPECDQHRGPEAEGEMSKGGQRESRFFDLFFHNKVEGSPLEVLWASEKSEDLQVGVEAQITGLHEIQHRTGNTLKGDSCLVSEF